MERDRPPTSSPSILLAFDGDGNLYVADTNNLRVEMFPPGSTSATEGTTVAGGNGDGSAANQLSYPRGVAIGADGYLYVSDTNNRRIQKFPAGSTSATNGTTAAGGNGPESDANQVYNPFGIDIDSNGNLYIAEATTNRIRSFPPGSTSATNGHIIFGDNGYGSAANQFASPGDVAVAADGSIFVSDTQNHRIQKIASDVDGDGVDNPVDNCPSVKNTNQANKDGDGFGNRCDTDVEGDGVDNEIDNCVGRINANQLDRDHDGIGNRCDPDLDGDLVLNTVDNCPNRRNAAQADKDRDGIGNKCDPDRDGDLVLNGVDNCPAKANAKQNDRDKDGVGNKCDAFPEDATRS